MEIPRLVETQEDFERVHSTFTGVQELKLQIEDQNNRFDEAETVVNEKREIFALIGPDVADEVLSSAREGIAEEQGETFFDLSETMRDTGEIYDMIGVLGVRLSKEIETASRSIGELEAASEAKDAEHKALMQEKETAVSDQLEEVLRNLERLSPRALPDVKTMLDDGAKGSAASNPDVRRLEDEILDLYEKKENEQKRLEALQEQNTRLEELYRQFGGNWALPKALIEILGADPSNWILIDELPVEPKLSPRDHERFADLRRRYVDQPEASIYTAVYLVDHIGETVTVDDIARFLYADKPGKTTTNMRSRVTTHLGPKRDHISKILLAEGYILQYGWRRALGRTGTGGEIKHVKPRERIYRAVSLSDSDALDTIEDVVHEQAGLRDEFEVTEPMREAVAEYAAAKEAAGLNDAATQASTEKTPEKREEWMRELNKKIGEAISVLEGEKLLDSPEGEVIKLIRKKSNSRIFATEETIKILTKANHLRSLHNLEHNALYEAILTPAEMVLMKLFNRNKQYFDKNAPRRDQALALIDAALEAYFENKARANEQQRG